MALQSAKDPGEAYVEKNPHLRHGCTNPDTAKALKWVTITALVLAVVGGLVAIALTHQFSSNGWLNQVAFPAMRKFFEMKTNLTIGEGLAYIAAPFLGGGIIFALGYKYAISCIQERGEEDRQMWISLMPSMGIP